MPHRRGCNWREPGAIVLGACQHSVSQRYERTLFQSGEQSGAPEKGLGIGAVDLTRSARDGTGPDGDEDSPPDTADVSERVHTASPDWIPAVR